MAGSDMAIGILLAAVGAALLALSMSVQRYGLMTPAPVPFLSYRLPQFWVWFAGLLIYFAANGIYAISLLFAPLSLLAGVFTTLLIWNLYFGKRFLNEELTPQKCQGASVVMFGVVLTVISTSDEVPTEFATRDIEKLFTKTSGCLYFVFLVIVILICVAIIALFEKKYPLNEEMTFQWAGSKSKLTLPPTIRGSSEVGTGATRTPGQQVEVTIAKKQSSDNLLVPGSCSQSPHELGFGRPPFVRSFTTSFDMRNTSPLVDYIRGFSSFYVKPREVQRNENIPKWVDRCMVIIYPGSLGLDEGVAHLSMKAFMSMLAQCGTTDTCGEIIVWLMVLLWLVSSLATLWWMRTVFKRYEITTALPIEYGAVMAVNALSGLTFYNESLYMANWQIGMMVMGVLVILIGLVLGLRENESPKESPLTTPRDSSEKVVKFKIMEPPTLEAESRKSVVKDTTEQAVVDTIPEQAVEESIPDKAKNENNELERQESYDDAGILSNLRTNSPGSNGNRSFQQSFREITVELGVDIQSRKIYDL